MCHIIVFPADQLAIPDKEHLHHGFSLILIHGNDILVFPCAVRHLLLLGYLLHTVVEIPIPCCRFEIQFLCRRPHLFLQIVENQTIIAIEKFQCLRHLGPILLLIHISLAGRAALLDMIVKARPL